MKAANGWRTRGVAMVPALAAAALAEAAGGLVVASLESRSEHDYIGGATFFMVVATVGLVDAVLVPGWIWRRGRPRLVPLTARLVVALGTPIIAVFVALAAVRLIAELGNSMPPGIAGWSDSFDAGGRTMLFGGTFAIAGVMVGLGAAAAQAVDAVHTPGGRVRSHVMGAVLGLGAILLTETMFNGTQHPGRFLLALPLLLALAALPHNALVLRDAIRRGEAMPDPATMLPRAAVCVVVLALAGAAWAVTTQ